MEDVVSVLAPKEPRSTLPRKPQRSNGRVKYEKLLDTLEVALETHDIADISLTGLAQAAGVAVASVYHFFPGTEAALVALAERYVGLFEDMLAVPEEDEQCKTWQDLMALKADRARAFYHSNLPALKVFLGPNHSWRIRQVDVASDKKLADLIHQSCMDRFVLPESSDLKGRFAIAIAISDAIWSLSYVQNGMITDEMAEEAKRASAAYLKLYMGEFFEVRRLP